MCNVGKILYQSGRLSQDARGGVEKGGLNFDLIYKLNQAIANLFFLMIAFV
jgi:hypothetical protein